jgi:pyruvate kinase
LIQVKRTTYALVTVGLQSTNRIILMPESLTPLPHTIHILLPAMPELRDNIVKIRSDLMRSWTSSIKRPSYASSAQNLAEYIGLRRYDIRFLQMELAALGLSSLGRCESHVLPSLDAVRNALRLMAGERVAQKSFKELFDAIEEGSKALTRNTDQLFGPAPKNRSTRFMVTLPSDAALDYALVRELLNHGMNCARINCAHDNPSLWEQMVVHIRNAERETGRRCRILMDLAGPKLRTGPLKAAAPILHIKVRRDEQGTTAERTRVVLDASGRPGCSNPAVGWARSLAPD